VRRFEVDLSADRWLSVVSKHENAGSCVAGLKDPRASLRRPPSRFMPIAKEGDNCAVILQVSFCHYE
jgi:hypothetical protein